MITDDNEKNPKTPIGYHCKKCDFLSSNKKDYNRHINTIKHKMGEIITNDNPITQKTPKYECSCGKNYKYSSGLSLHKKKCQQLNKFVTEKNNDLLSKEEISLKDMFLEMVNQNKELQKTIQEQNKTIQEIVPKVGTTNNTNNISIVNNLTLLNTSCKDALSLNEFIDSIQVEIKDLIYTSEKGLTNGVANLFLKNYNKLPLQMRPLWCSDKKRKKIYIKQGEGEWEEDVNQIKMKQAIKTLTSIQARSSGKYTRENPDWMEHDNKKETFVHIVKETTEEMNEPKQIHIINNLLDEVHLTDTIKSELRIA